MNCAVSEKDEAGRYTLAKSPIFRVEASVEEGRVRLKAAGPLARLPFVKSALGVADSQIPVMAGERLILSTWFPPSPAGPSTASSKATSSLPLGSGPQTKSPYRSPRSAPTAASTAPCQIQVATTGLSPMRSRRSSARSWTWGRPSSSSTAGSRLPTESSPISSEPSTTGLFLPCSPPEQGSPRGSPMT